MVHLIELTFRAGRENAYTTHKLWMQYKFLVLYSLKSDFMQVLYLTASTVWYNTKQTTGADWFLDPADIPVGFGTAPLSPLVS